MVDLDKVIICNASALKTKYGSSGFIKLKTALDKLVETDAERGLKSRLIFIDDISTMKKFGGTPPIGVADERGAKRAIDAIAAATTPDYIVLIDGPDVIPHIALNNPVPDDPDNTIDSDLPYASDVPFAKDPARYLKVTRVVGRVPNVPGATKPDRLIGFIEKAIKAVPTHSAKYKPYFGLSAAVWKASTAMSLDAVFGDHDNIDTAPPSAPPKTDHRFASLSHFINCHGSPLRPEFYGQHGNSYPVSITSKQVAQKGLGGTVVAAECCYGAQLYDPALARVDDPICIAYLSAGALGFLGSTNIAYGPPDANGQADLLTQYFLNHVMQGASLGRALLQARQEFINYQLMTDPTNLKTLAQFILLGEPSTTPCVKSNSLLPSSDEMDPRDQRAQRKGRRLRLESAGAAIPRGKAIVGSPTRISADVKHRLEEIAASKGYTNTKLSAFSVTAPPSLGKAFKANGADTKVVVMSSTFEAPDQIVAIRHLVAHIIGDGIAKVTETVSR